MRLGRPCASGVLREERSFLLHGLPCSKRSGAGAQRIFPSCKGPHTNEVSVVESKGHAFRGHSLEEFSLSWGLIYKIIQAW